MTPYYTRAFRETSRFAVSRGDSLTKKFVDALRADADATGTASGNRHWRRCLDRSDAGSPGIYPIVGLVAARVGASLERSRRASARCSWRVRARQRDRRLFLSSRRTPRRGQASERF